ncbi:MAG: hypothetical protein ACREQL_04520, partial [Candidatus Binatia bacterium]
ALLAGVGAAGLARSSPTTAVAARVSVLTLLFAFAAARVGLPRPVPLEAIETRGTLPPVYGSLASAAPGPVLELTWYDFDLLPAERGVDARRTYRSVYDWRPLLNGYSGYAPRTYPLVSALVHSLPDRDALVLLARMTGLRYVLLERDDPDAGERLRWERLIDERLTLIARDGPTRLFALRDPPPADLQAAFVSTAPAEATLTGTPLSALEPAGRAARVRAVGTPPAAARRRLRFAIPVEVTNVSTRTWPVLAVAPRHLVAIGTRWEHADGRIGGTYGLAGRMPFDLSPGATAPALVGVRAPEEPGPWRLVIGVVQDGVWFDGDTLSVPVEVR